MAKAVTARRAKIPKSGKALHDWKYLWLMFPMVVTSGEMFVLDSNRFHPTLDPAPWIEFVRELESGKLSGTYVLHFVQKERLEEHVR